MTLWTNIYDRINDRRYDRRYDPAGHLMTVKKTVDSTGGPIVRLILDIYISFLKLSNKEKWKEYSTKNNLEKAKLLNLCMYSCIMF